MKTICLDIETWSPSWKDGEHGWDKDSFPPTAYHEPVAIVWLVVSNHRTAVDGNVDVSCEVRLEAHRVDVVGEDKILNMLRDDFASAGRLVTWNGRGFDMPVLSCRALALGIDWSWWHQWRHRFPTYKEELKHYDLKDQIGDYGAARGFRLDRVAQLCGLPGKPDDIDGSMVSMFWQQGEEHRQRVLDYCIGDVLDLYGIYLRFAQSFLRVPSVALEQTREALDELKAKIGHEHSH